MQPLSDRRSQTIPFLSWEERSDTWETCCHPGTLYQLLETSHGVLQGLGLRFSEQHGDAFQIDHCPEGGIFVIPPKLYLQCSDDPKTYLSFDWYQWLVTTNYILGAPNDPAASHKHQP